MIRKQVKDFDVEEKIECIVCPRGKNKRRLRGEIVEKRGKKHLVGSQTPRLSFGPGTILESKDKNELDYEKRKTRWQFMYLVGTARS